MEKLPTEKDVAIFLPDNEISWVALTEVMLPVRGQPGHQERDVQKILTRGIQRGK